MKNAPNSISHQFRKNVFNGYVVFAILLSLAWYFFAFSKQSDFIVFYRAANNFLNSWNLNRGSDDFYVYKYFFFNVIPILPFTIFPLKIAQSVFVGVNFLFLVWFYKLILPILKKTSIFSKKSVRYLGAVLILLLFKYQIREIELGQVNLIATVFALLSVIYLSKGKTFATVFCFSFAILWKPYYLAFGLFFLCLRKWKVLFGVAGFFLATHLLAILVWSPDYILSTYIDLFNMLKGQEMSFLTGRDETSYRSFFVKMFRFSKERAIHFGNIFSILSLLLYYFIGNKKRKFIESNLSSSLFFASTLIMFLPILSPQGWHYLFQCAGFLHAFLFLWLKNNGAKSFFNKVIAIQLFLIGITVFDLMGRKLYGLYSFLGFQTLNYLILFYCALILIFTEFKQPSNFFKLKNSKVQR